VDVTLHDTLTTLLALAESHSSGHSDKEAVMRDVWLANTRYSVSVAAQNKCRVEATKTLSIIFAKVKALEARRRQVTVHHIT
jgi:hypothetical protein